jgi:hypothetical protein
MAMGVETIRVLNLEKYTKTLTSLADADEVIASRCRDHVWSGTLKIGSACASAKGHNTKM